MNIHSYLISWHGHVNICSLGIWSRNSLFLKCSQYNIHWAQTDRQTSNTQGTISKNLKETELRYTQTGKDWRKRPDTRGRTPGGSNQYRSVSRSGGKRTKTGIERRLPAKIQSIIFLIIIYVCQHWLNPAMDTDTEVIWLNGWAEVMSAAAATSCTFSLRRSRLLPPADRIPDPTPATWALNSNDLVVDLVSSLKGQLGAD